MDKESLKDEVRSLKAKLRRQDKRLRRIQGDLAVAVDIFHEAGKQRSWHSDRDDDVAQLLKGHWPVTKDRER